MPKNRIVRIIVVLLVMGLPVKGTEETGREEKPSWVRSSATQFLLGLLSPLPNPYAFNSWSHKPSREELESIRQAWHNAAEEVRAQEEILSSFYNVLSSVMSNTIESIRGIASSIFGPGRHGWSIPRDTKELSSFIFVVMLFTHIDSFTVFEEQQ